MIIDPEKCTGCGECVKYCAVSAIALKKKKARIEPDLCAECGNCLRVEVCPGQAISPEPIAWPRTLRNIFSDPISVFEETGITGRGTEEMKTNDVTGRFAKGEIGFAVDVGRPNGGGFRLREIDKITRALAALPVRFEKASPVTYCLEDPEQGTLKKEILNELVISAVIEFKTDLAHCPVVVETLEEVSRHLDTVISIGVISVVEEDGIIPVKSLLEKNGLAVSRRGKTNIGLGRRGP